MLNRLIVQTRDGFRHEDVEEWTALVVLAALAAEPETIEELIDAVGRYQPATWATWGQLGDSWGNLVTVYVTHFVTNIYIVIIPRLGMITI